MRCRVPVLVCALLLCLVAIGAAPALAQPDAEETHFEAQLQDDGDAEWTIAVSVPFTNETDRDRFESFAEAFEAGREDLDPGHGAFQQAAAEAERAADREMAVTAPRRDSAIVEGENGTEYGELRVTFVWESFARIDDNGTLYVDDAFNTTNGPWLPGLEDDQSLTIAAPPGYAGPTTSPIGAEEGDLHWEGPETFGPGYFTIVYPQSSPGPAPDVGISTMLLWGALLLSGAALLLGLYLLVARHWPPTGRHSGSGSEETPPDASADGSPPGGTSAEPTSDDAAGSDAETADDEIDMELLSDEERVEYLLEQNGGRMKQANIVKETGWSNAKVSQLLSSMADEDRVDKLRIGRENLISLPGEGIDDIDTNDE